MAKRITVAALLVMLTGALAVRAHEGHAHARTMGTVASLEAGRAEVRTTDGANVSIRLDEKTKYRSADKPATAGDVKVGDRVVVKTKGTGAELTASEIRFSHSGK